MSAEATTEDKPQFVKKKISLTRRHAEKLKRLANDHHGGIQSQCVRRALDNYEQAVRGENDLTVKKVHATTREIKDLVERLDEQLEADDSVVQQDPQEDPEAQIHAHAREVRRYLGDEPTTLAEILNQVEIPERRVRYALVYLEDRGMIERIPSEVSYQMTK